MTARVETIQTRHKGLMNRAEDALVQLYDAIQEAKSRGGPQPGKERHGVIQNRVQAAARPERRPQSQNGEPAIQPDQLRLSPSRDLRASEPERRDDHARKQ